MKRTVQTRYQLKYRQSLPALFTALMLTTAPALAESPVGKPAFTLPNAASQVTLRQNAIRQNNARRLILLNECRDCDLAGVTLTEAHLIGADLRDANLRGANLTGSNLEGADLTGADLTGANLTDTFLTNACLANTQLNGVNFSGAHLYDVDVTGASITHLNLTGTQLLNTPIYVGGEEQPAGEPLEPIIPCEFPNPAEPYEPLIDPSL